MSLSYWEKRMEEGLYRVDQKAFHTEVNLLRRFQKAKKEIQKSIEDILKGSDGKPLPLKGDASAYIDSLSEQEIKKLFPGYSVVKKNGKSYLVNESTSRALTRQTALEAQLERSIESLRDYQDKKMGEMLGNAYEEEYYRSLFAEMKDAGVAFDFASLDTKAIRRAVDTRWCQGENYSDRVWKNKALLERALDKHVVQGIVKGEDFGKMVNQVAHEMNVGYHSAQRLVRTEANRIYNQASMDSYAEGGIEEYQILATLDRKTSKICREQDGKRYSVKDMKVGVNAPPFHPNCRTTTIPVVDFNKITERAARSQLSGKTITVPGDMTYEEWYDKFVIERGLDEQISELADRIEQNDGTSMESQSLKDAAKAIIKNTPKAKRAIWDYSTDAYDTIQRVALGTATQEDIEYALVDVKEQEKTLHDVLSNSRTPEVAYVNRGVSQNTMAQTLRLPEDARLSEILDRLKSNVGGIIREPAYLSTTTNSKQQMSGSVFAKREIQYHIEVPKGAPALYIEEYAAYSTERELLIDKGQFFQILKVEYESPGYIHVFLKMLI